MAEHVAWQSIDGETVIVDLLHHRALGLNTTGSLVWSSIEHQSLAEIVDLVSDHFPRIERQRLEQDVTQFVDTMVDRGLLAPS